MITNERQYRITRARVDKLKEAIGTFDIKEVAKHAKSKVLAKAELNALQSELEELYFQVKEYETLKSGSVLVLKANTFEDLPSILIRARIVKGLSQRMLAELVGIKEQQMQRYEAEEYASASLSRLGEIARALELNISEVAEFNIVQKPLDNNAEVLEWGKFPVKEMYKRNWFEDYFSGSLSEAVNNATELVKNFIVDVLDQPIRSAARQRIRSGGTVNIYALLAWQCRVMHLARKINLTKAFNNQTIDAKWLSQLAKLSCQDNGPPKAVEYLQESGIRLVIEPHLPHTHLDGVALLLDDEPVIGMTLRHDRLDNFWFVLFHELVHIKEHLHKGKVETIFDDLEADANDIEKEADRDAGEVLVPESKWSIALARFLRSEESIIDFANELKINPAIIAGKIQREAGNYTILTDIVGRGKVRKLFPEIDFSY